MTPFRILVFGGNGQVGQALRHAPCPENWLMRSVARDECDLRDPGAIASVMRHFAPDIVINAAAMTQVEACEADPQLATTVNFHAVANIAAQCDTLDAPLIHLSTDYVFDGTDGMRPYEPNDTMNPINVYGQTKMMGEEAVRHGLHWHVILRTSLIFSRWGQNVLTRTVKQIEAGQPIQAVNGQQAGPTAASAVAEALMVITSAILGGKGNGFGTFHLCGTPLVTRYDFIRALLDAYAAPQACANTLVAVTQGDDPARAPRPAYSGLNCEKITSVYGIAPRAWQQDLATEIAALKNESVSQ